MQTALMTIGDQLVPLAHLLAGLCGLLLKALQIAGTGGLLACGAFLVAQGSQSVLRLSTALIA